MPILSIPIQGGPTWEETTDSGSTSVSFNASSVDLRYTILGCETLADAVSFVEAQIASGGFDTFDLDQGELFLYDYKLAPQGDGTLFICTLNYRFQVDYFEITTDTTGGTKKMLQALDQGEYYGVQNTDILLPSFGGLVGVSDDNVQGVEVPDGKYDFTVVIRQQLSTMPQDFLDDAECLSGFCNEAALVINWKGQQRFFGEEELLFYGMVSKETSEDQLEISMKFGVQRTRQIPNIVNSETLNGGPITKKGWRYAWVYTRQVTTAGSSLRVPQPVVLVINKVIDTADLSILGIFQ